MGFEKGSAFLVAENRGANETGRANPPKSALLSEGSLCFPQIQRNPKWNWAVT
jgi:hypothetical protein